MEHLTARQEAPGSNGVPPGMVLGQRPSSVVEHLLDTGGPKCNSCYLQLTHVESGGETSSPILPLDNAMHTDGTIEVNNT